MRQYLSHRKRAIRNALQGWFGGQLRLAGLMFLLNLIGLSTARFFGLPIQNIFGLSLIAGAMEFVPYI